MEIEEIKKQLDSTQIQIHDIIENNKASEIYIKVTYIQENGFRWETYLPICNRRAGLLIESEKEVVEYLKKQREYFTLENMEKWKLTEENRWKESKAEVTKGFFDSLLSFKIETTFPANNNPARRIQDLKEMGYTIASIPNYLDGQTGRILLPIPMHTERGYETFSPQFKNRVIRLLKGVNAYEAKQTNAKALIPDHKFSEIRWDENTKEENPIDMSDEDIIKKFQLLDNQRNQQKREICRSCFQTGIRGQIYGIDFFPEGSKEWNTRIPKIGKEAEKGCIGCPWYDIEEWRSKLKEKLQ